MDMAENKKYEYLSRESFGLLKGYLAIMVLISHLYQFSGLFAGTYFGQFLNSLGHFGVIGFIFLSGYGLFSSYSEKGKSYVVSFTRKRLLPFFITYTITVFVYLAYEIYFGAGTVDMMSLVKSFTVGATIISFGWYLQYMLWLYIFFWIVYITGLSDRTKSVIVGILAILFVAYGMMNSGVITRYTIVICFLFGFNASYYKDVLTEMLDKMSLPIFFVSLMCVFVDYKISESGLNIYLKVASSLIADIAFILIMLIVVKLIVENAQLILDNPISRFCGDFSLEIYIVQAMVLRLLVKTMNNPWVYVAKSVVIIMVIAVVYHYFLKLVLLPLKK